MGRHTQQCRRRGGAHRRPFVGTPCIPSLWRVIEVGVFLAIPARDARDRSAEYAASGPTYPETLSSMSRTVISEVGIPASCRARGSASAEIDLTLYMSLKRVNRLSGFMLEPRRNSNYSQPLVAWVVCVSRGGIVTISSLWRAWVVCVSPRTRASASGQSDSEVDLGGVLTTPMFKTGFCQTFSPASFRTGG